MSLRYLHRSVLAKVAAAVYRHSHVHVSKNIRCHQPLSTSVHHLTGAKTTQSKHILVNFTSEYFGKKKGNNLEKSETIKHKTYKTAPDMRPLSCRITWHNIMHLHDIMWHSIEKLTWHAVKQFAATWCHMTGEFKELKSLQLSLVWQQSRRVLWDQAATGVRSWSV